MPRTRSIRRARHQPASVLPDVYSGARHPLPRVCRQLLDDLKTPFELINRSGHVDEFAIQSRFNRSILNPYTPPCRVFSIDCEHTTRWFVPIQRLIRRAGTSVQVFVTISTSEPAPRVCRELLEELNDLFELIDRSSHIGTLAVRSRSSSSIAHPHTPLRRVFFDIIYGILNALNAVVYLSEHTLRQSTCTA